jgi:hypothetical protein
MSSAPSSIGPTRDLRLDFFRGVALLCIFIDHIPGNQLAGYTYRNLGLSDASELFVFISAYTAGLVYTRRMCSDGWTRASLGIWRRAGRTYVFHFVLLVVFCALVGWATAAFDNVTYVQGLNTGSFQREPVLTILEAIRLRFQPIFMDILPLYIVLLAFLPIVLWLIRLNHWMALALSLALYAAARMWQLSLPDFPNEAPWKFNPFAWQLLFVSGAVLGALMALNRLRLPRRPLLLGAAALYAIASYFVSRAFWAYEGSSALPAMFDTLLLPVMERPNLSIWRIAHILALAYITTWFLRADHPFLRSRWVRPLTLCGQHSLPIFCLGVLLSLAGWIVLTEVGSGRPYQVLVTVGGAAIMSGVAFALTAASRALRGSAARTRVPAAALAEIQR